MFIGRLDSYKRLDWLIEALVQLSVPWRLVVVGDGPKRSSFEELAQCLFPQASPVQFLGRLSETAKLQQIAMADVLVLPSDRSNEAFGIVQLEAMAAGRIALALHQPRSGMSWVGRLHSCLVPDPPQFGRGFAEACRGTRFAPKLSAQSRARYLTLFARSVWLQQLKRLDVLVETGKV